MLPMRLRPPSLIASWSAPRFSGSCNGIIGFVAKRIGKYSKKYSRPFRRQGRFQAWLHATFPWFFRLKLWQRIALVLGAIFIVLVLIAVATYLYYYNDIADKNRLMNASNTGVVLLDKNGEVFYSFGQAKAHEMVSLSEIAQTTKNALIASEDKDFYKHGGFSFTGYIRAALTGVGGGSTISQQLAKNTLLTKDKSFLRKYQELTLSLAIEQRYSKDEILEMYLNSVYFGEGAFGIKDAAKVYFSKAAKDLTLAESAMLIGLLPAPAAYSPISGNVTYAKERQTTVLSRMVANNYITEAEKTAALAQQLTYAPPDQSQTVAPHFAEMVMNELYEKYGEETVNRSGYRVHTTLDLGLQKEMYTQAQKQTVNIQRYGGSNSAGVAIDAKTGEIRALYGSIDYNNEKFGKVNMAITPRQPASSFKPIYYSAALASGTVTPGTVIKDEPINISGYSPKNASGRYYGDVTVRYALSNSLNIPSVKIAQKLGVSNVISAAQRLGLSEVKDSDTSHGLSIALGSVEVSAVHMVNAYAAFANKGVYYDTTIVKSIDNKFGNKIFSSSTTSHRGVSEQGAYLLTKILSDSATRAPTFGSTMNVSGKDVAAKTGTSENARDAWTIGYSPDIAIGVWVGNNDNTEMAAGGWATAAPIWRAAMTYATKNVNSKFEQPSGITSLKICKADGNKALSDGEGVYSEFFLTSAQPTGTCDPNPKMITVCNLDTVETQSIKEKDFDENKYSMDLTKCDKKKTISVCDLQSGKVVTIDEKDYDSTIYSKDTTNCKSTTTSKTIQVCHLQDKKIVSIKESEYDSTLYSKNLADCQTTTTTTP